MVGAQEISLSYRPRGDGEGGCDDRSSFLAAKRIQYLRLSIVQSIKNKEYLPRRRLT
jgi:hypothetical protein